MSPHTAHASSRSTSQNSSIMSGLNLRSPRPPSPHLFTHTAGTFTLWTLAFLLLTFAAWLMGTLRLMRFYAADHHHHHRHHHRPDVGDAINSANSYLQSSGGSGSIIVVDDATIRGGRGVGGLLLVEALWFLVGFVSLCLAAFCLTLETCKSAGKKTDVWAKYSKEV